MTSERNYIISGFLQCKALPSKRKEHSLLLKRHIYHSAKRFTGRLSIPCNISLLLTTFSPERFLIACISNKFGLLLFLALICSGYFEAFQNSKSSLNQCFNQKASCNYQTIHQHFRGTGTRGEHPNFQVIPVCYA